MKRILLYIASLMVAMTVSAQHSQYKGHISVEPQELAQKGDSLDVHILFDIRGITVSSRQTLTFTPTLVSGSVFKDLPGIEIKGRNSFLLAKRHKALMTRREKAAYERTHILPYITIKGYGRKRQKQVDYKLSIPFESWMKESHLNMAENICNCSRKPYMLSMSQLVSAVQLEQPRMPRAAYEIHPSLAYIQPLVETVKHREMVGEAFLDFVMSKTDIRPDYMNNPRELKKITDMMLEARNDSAIKIRDIYVIGYASPEGKLKFNQYLSESRAKALVNYLNPLFDFPLDMYHVQFGGENWAGLEEKVVRSDIQYKDEILYILRNVPAEIDYSKDTSRKKVLMLLRGGEPYLYMMKEYFPSLRKAICKLEYEVRGFTVDEAKDLLYKRPQNLSLNEMYLVANLYQPGTPEFCEVFEIAVRMFPSDQAANLNAAAAALSRGDLRSAEIYLGRISDFTPEYYNAMGALQMLKGDYAQAEAQLTKAAGTGLLEAKTNLEELARKRKDMELQNTSNN